MDYEQLYKEALKRAKKLYEQGTITESLSYVFPELKESEDERIRNVLVELVKGNERCGYFMINNITTSAMIAWIEKQGEQKPANKVEPKFKEGDWVVWYNENYKVNYNGWGYELIDQNGLSTSLEYGTVDGSAHLWDVAEDTKDGDVLATENFIFIFKNIDNGNGVHYYCHYEISKHEDDSQFGVALPQSLMGKVGSSLSHYSPATKEQRDLLKKAITEAGYRWKAETKELIKVPRPKEATGVLKQLLDEEKSWSKEDELMKLSIEQVINCASFLNIVPEKMNKIKTWLKQLKYRIGG